MQHIFLTGFMGSGKSTLGKKLAALLRLRFVDLDHYLEKKEEISIPLIFETQGEAAFREKETHYLKEIIASAQPLVIGLGGGTVCFGANLQLIKQHGLLIYIDVPAHVLAERLQNSKKERPLLAGLAGNVLLQRITNKLEERLPFYTQAHLTVQGTGITAQLLQHAILEAKHT